MPTKAQHLKEPSSAEKKETKLKPTLPTAAQAAKKRETTGASATKNSAKAKTSKPKPKAAGAKTTATPKSKSSAKAPSDSTSAKTKAKSSVKSTKTKSTTKKTAAVKKPAKATTKKTAAVKKPAKATTKAKTAVKKAAKTGGKAVARRPEKARPADEKKATEPAKKEKPVITSETAKKVANSLIRSRAKKKSQPRKTKAKAPRPSAFTLDEAIEIAKTQKVPEETGAKVTQKPAKTDAAAAKKKEPIEEVKQENRVLGAASLSDILGYNPNTGPKSDEKDTIPSKFQRYYKLLIELRDVVKDGLEIHTKETLNRSTKEDSENLSAYGQHTADSDADTFDRDFALNLVSSEQEALYEIEDAIRRIKQGTYGICEITGKPINKERLLAVPFARYSMEGQVEYEQTKRRNTVRGSILADGAGEGLRFMDTNSDDE